MGRVSRARADLRRARRGLRKLEEEQSDLIDDLGDSLADLDLDGLDQVQKTLDRIDRHIERERSRIGELDDQLEALIEARAEKRREAWEDVRSALARFGPSLLDIVGDVVMVASSPREKRIEIASRALLDHVQIAIDPGDVTALAEAVVSALED
jgi:chromosome segregation ATPase